MLINSQPLYQLSYQGMNLELRLCEIRLNGLDRETIRSRL